jgi:hypothetical protein
MSPDKAALAALLCCVAAVMTGCSTNQFVSGTDLQPMEGAALAGMVHGGQNPIVGATVQLWAVGSGSYGAAATALGAPVTTGATGGFTLGTYTCPSASTLTYITASSGNPGVGSNNPNIMLVAALGNCGTLNSGTSIFINEVTTAATAFALGQYFTPTFGASSTDSFGAPVTPSTTAQSGIGIANAFATVNNLVCGVSTNANCTGATGNAVTSATLTGAAGSITMTPESAKLYTIADILAACVNSAGGTSGDSSSCGTLFADVVPAGGIAPTDTLQAAVDMSLNPTSNNANGSSANLLALFGLITANPPYAGYSAPYTAGSQPADWTLGIQYSGPKVVATTVLNAPLDLRADASGNIWLINVPSATAAASESLTELSPTGVPLANPWNAGGSASGTTMASSTPRNMAIDLTGNVWVTTTSGSAWVYQWQPYLTVPAGVSMKDPGAPYGIAVDANNNVFIGHGNSASSVTSLDEFTGGVLAATNWIKYPLDGSAGNASSDYGQYAAVDTAGNVWHAAAAASTSSPSVVEITAMNGVATCGATPFAAPCTTTTDSSLTATYTADSGGSQDGVWGMAANINSMWAGNASASSVTSLALTGGAGTTYGSGAAFAGPRFLAVDGSGNVWASNFNTAAISELNSAGTILSPQNTGTAPANTIGYQHAGLASSTGITIDPSGNVWVANDVAATASVGSSVFELVGAASPTVTPLALALKNGTVGAKP